MGYYENIVDQYFALLVLIPIGLILLVSGMMLYMDIMLNQLAVSHREIWPVRQMLGFKLKRAYLGNMLKALGVDRRAYQRAMPAASLRSQLNACKACSAKAQCRAATEGQCTTLSRIDFCPNKPELAWALDMPQ